MAGIRLVLGQGECARVIEEKKKEIETLNRRWEKEKVSAAKVIELKTVFAG